MVAGGGEEGILKMQLSGRWAVCRDGQEPVEITSGDQFWIEIPGGGGVMVQTRMECGFIHGRQQYYSIGGHELRENLRAAFVGKRFWA